MSNPLDTDRFSGCGAGGNVAESAMTPDQEASLWYTARTMSKGIKLG